MNDVDDILTPTSIWLKQKRRIALATVISTWGSSPRPVGGQMAIDENGEIIGSVSGGCIEGAVISEGICAIKDGKSRIKDYGISNDMAWEVGLACGGELKVLIQPLKLEDKIIYSKVFVIPSISFTFVLYFSNCLALSAEQVACLTSLGLSFL